MILAIEWMVMVATLGNKRESIALALIVVVIVVVMRMLARKYGNR